MRSMQVLQSDFHILNEITDKMSSIIVKLNENGKRENLWNFHKNGREFYQYFS